MFKRFFKSDKTKMLEKVVNRLEERGNTDIRAELSGYQKPQKVVRVSDNTEYFPDVTSTKEGQFRLFAIEYGKVVKSNMTVNRWKLFEAFSSQNNAVFYIVCSSGQVMDVKKILLFRL